MPEIFFNNYGSPVHATSPQSQHSHLIHSPGSPSGFWSNYDSSHTPHQRPTSPAFSSAGASMASGGLYHNTFSQYLPTASFSPSPSSGNMMSSQSHMSPASLQSMASPTSLNTAALLQHQRHPQAQHYQQQHPQSKSPRHFNFAASEDYEIRSDIRSGGSNLFSSGSFQRSRSFHNNVGSTNSPRNSFQAPCSDADMTYDQTHESSYELPQDNMVCQDERDGLLSLLSCSMVSPRNGDERIDVLSEDEDDLFLFSEDDAEKQVASMVSGEQQQEQLEEKRSAPSMEEIAKSLSCFSAEAPEEQSRKEVEETPLRHNKKGVLSPVSLADHDGMSDDEGTIDDTVDDDTLNENLEEGHHASEVQEQVVVEKTKIKKTVTIVEEEKSIVESSTQESHHETGNTKKGSLLEQAKERDPHADIKPYKTELHIPDDESEASMLVLMRYMGCTPRAYGEHKRIDSGLPSGREFVFESDDDEDDATTLSGTTYESSVRGSVKYASTWSVHGDGEEGFELTLDDCLPPNTRLKRSVSLDEGTVMSSSVNGAGTFEDIAKSASMPEEESESLVESVDPIDAAMKAVQVAISPRAEAFGAESQKHEAAIPPDTITSSDEVPKEAPAKATVDASSKVGVEKAAVDESVASLSRRRKPVLTVTTGSGNGSPILVKTALVKEDDQKTKPASNLSRVPFSVQSKEPVLSPASIGSTTVGSKAISPAPEARTYLAFASNSKPQQAEQEVYLASPKQIHDSVVLPIKSADKLDLLDLCSQKEMVLSPVTLGSIVTKDSNPVSPASAARAFLASDLSIVSQTASTKKSQVKKPADAASFKSKRKQEVDDLIKAYLSRPKDENWDKDAFIASVKMNSESNGLPKPTPKSQPTPRINNVTAPSKASSHQVAPTPVVLSGTKADTARKKLEPTGVTLTKKKEIKSAMTPLEMKLAKKKTLKPIRTAGSLTDMQIDQKNSALSPVSAISEGTMETLDTMALIQKAQAVSSKARARTSANKNNSSADLLKRAHSMASDKSFSSGSKVSAVIGTIREDPEPTPLVVKEHTKRKTEHRKTTEKTAFSEEVLNKYRRDITALKERSQANHTRVTTANHRSAVNPPGQLASPEESSSFDKNEVIKEKNKDSVPITASLHKTPEKKTELKIAVVSPDDNAREPPPPLTPCRESVREVDELLSKTRSWLAQHNHDRHTRVGITRPAGIPTRTAATSVGPSAKITDASKNVTSPANSEKSILQELVDLKERQIKLSMSSARIGFY